VTLSPGSSNIESGLTPQESLTLSWSTFSNTADEAGISRRYGGIHFEAGDLAGRGIVDPWSTGVIDSMTMSAPMPE
jgi:hypothetical protein